MSNKNSRHTPSPSPSSPPPNHPPSKLPKFLQKQSNRDRSRSFTDSGVGGSPSTSSITSGNSAASPSPEPHHSAIPIPKPRKTSKFLSINKDKEDKSRKSADTPPTPDNSTPPNNGSTSAADVDDPPVIVEPVSIPRPRTRSERPASSVPETYDHIPIPTLYSSASSTSRIGDLPTRLSGWFSHTFSTSSTDLSLTSLLAQQSSATSPKGKGPSALLTAAKHGKGHLDKAMRYLLDSDSTPDRCTDPIWLLGVQHPGYESPPPALPSVVSSSSSSSNNHNSGGGRRGSPASFRSSTSSVSSSTEGLSLSLSQSQGPSSKHANPAANWPPVFYIDFTSRIWLTYRSQFHTPIRDMRLADLCKDNCEAEADSPTTTAVGRSRVPWNWGAEKTWSSDSGWGCMLRTGQSLLANALVHMHLGRDWRRPPYPVQTADYATYVQILTWFLDTPAPEAPFSVHRMALAGKELGTDVGQWFGPSVAAGAIRTLVHSFTECGLAVSVATDGTLYQTQVYAASHGDTSGRSPRRRHTTSWGDRPVLLLLGIRLGIEGVNPIYHETVKMLYTFPQSVGIAGGRPSSSYYFVGSQADNLFYLDPHNARPAIPLRPPPPAAVAAAATARGERETSPESDRDSSTRHIKQPQPRAATPNNNNASTQHHRSPTSPSSVRTGSSNFSYHAPVSPSPLQQQFSTSSADSNSSSTNNSANYSYTHSLSRSPPPSYQGGHHGYGQHHSHSQNHGRWRSASHSHSQPVSPVISMSSSEMDHRELGMFGGGGEMPSENTSSDHNHGLDPVQLHYCTAYSAAELKTFHSERVRKMPMSGLDPSMLIGFLCRDEADWRDFRRRVGELPRTIFSVQEEPPTWPSDSDDNMGLESISEPDDMELDEEGIEVEIGGEIEGDDDEEDDEEDGQGESEQFFDTRSESASSVSNHDHDRRSSERGKSEDIDTEDDPVDPVTPGPGSRFDIVQPRSSLLRKGGEEGESEEDRDKELDFRPEDGEGFDVDDDGDDIEDDWVDPSLPTPTPSGSSPPSAHLRQQHVHQQQQAQPPALTKEPSPSPPSYSSVPPLAKGKSSSSSSSKHGSGSGSGKSKSKKTNKQIPVPVPSIRLPSQQHHQQMQQEHYPFPVTPADDPSFGSPYQERSRNSSTKGVGGGKRMHTARARDGGRTQSGGVKGILTDD